VGGLTAFPQLAAGPDRKECGKECGVLESATLLMEQRSIDAVLLPDPASGTVSADTTLAVM
jgi:hypothetical protein